MLHTRLYLHLLDFLNLSNLSKVYWMGDLLGGAMAAFTYEYIRSSKRPHFELGPSNGNTSRLGEIGRDLETEFSSLDSSNVRF